MKFGGPNEKDFFQMDSLYCTRCVVSTSQRLLVLGQPETGAGIAYWIALSRWILRRSSHIDDTDN